MGSLRSNSPDGEDPADPGLGTANRSMCSPRFPADPGYGLAGPTRLLGVSRLREACEVLIAEPLQPQKAISLLPVRGVCQLPVPRGKRIGTKMRKTTMGINVEFFDREFDMPIS